MKELSIEEKARACDEALALMVDCVPDEDGLVHVKPHEIFSELAESEDERIRKEFCKDIWNYIPYEKAQKYITWLKKQGEQKPILDVKIPFGAKDSELEEVSYSIPDGYHAEIEDNKIVIKKGEQKPTKVEPKFHEGDWCIDNEDGVIFQIVKVLDNTYTYKTNEGKEYSCTHYSLENDTKLWSIQDAKDGDVLAYVTDEEDLWIMIYWSLYEPYEGHVHYHALLVNDDFSDKGTCCICIDDLKPATKEQRDTLIAKMAEEGYEWDAEKKELRKIVPKSKWSEEDDERLQSCISSLQGKGLMGGVDTINTKWLKSLKQRLEEQ